MRGVGGDLSEGLPGVLEGQENMMYISREQETCVWAVGFCFEINLKEQSFSLLELWRKRLGNN